MITCLDTNPRFVFEKKVDFEQQHPLAYLQTLSKIFGNIL